MSFCQLAQTTCLALVSLTCLRHQNLHVDQQMLKPSLESAGVYRGNAHTCVHTQTHQLATPVLGMAWQGVYLDLVTSLKDFGACFKQRKCTKRTALTAFACDYFLAFIFLIYFILFI